MTEKEFQTKLANSGIILDDKMILKFRKYCDLIEKYNQVMDLTAVKGKENIYERHFYDSLTIAFQKDFNNLSLCDVGSGAGFPAIVLKIVFPNMKLTIIDSLNKRMEFLKKVVDELALSDVNIIVDRVEDVARQEQEKYDIVTARAVARLNILVELISQLIKINGTFIAMKGENGIVELNEAENALKINKLILQKTEIIGKNINLYFKKIDKVDKKYPRNYSQIKKKPL